MNAGHTVTITPADLHVEVRVDGEKVAETDRPVLLEETGMPTRYYLPREDVRMDLLRPTNFKTECPFKGQASYWTLELGDAVHDGIVWSYEDPIPAGTWLMAYDSSALRIRPFVALWLRCGVLLPKGWSTGGRKACSGRNGSQSSGCFWLPSSADALRTPAYSR